MSDWVPLKDFHLYEINSIGQIRHVKTKLIRKHVMRPDGYPQVKLQPDGKMRLVHRLLANTFIPNPENKPQINHKNGLRWDLSLDNLEWCTPGENMAHAFRVTKTKSSAGEKNPKSKMTAKDAAIIKTFISNKAAKKFFSKMHGINPGSVHNIIMGRSWHLPLS
jgi:hypothetical protein